MKRTIEYTFCDLCGIRFSDRCKRGPEEFYIRKCSSHRFLDLCNRCHRELLSKLVELGFKEAK